jgi:hypothetical protein
MPCCIPVKGFKASARYAAEATSRVCLQPMERWFARTPSAATLHSHTLLSRFLTEKRLVDPLAQNRMRPRALRDSDIPASRLHKDRSKL